MDSSYYMECIDEIQWKWMPNFETIIMNTCYFCSSKPMVYTLQFSPLGRDYRYKGIIILLFWFFSMWTYNLFWSYVCSWAFCNTRNVIHIHYLDLEYIISLPQYPFDSWGYSDIYLDSLLLHEERIIDIW